MSVKATLCATVATVCLATAAHANDRKGVDADANLSVQDTRIIRTISELPEEGMVEVKGVVKEVNDANEFILSDGEDTVDVHTNSTAGLKVGQNVHVTGEVNDEWYAGVEIVNAEVSRTGLVQGTVDQLSNNMTREHSGEKNASSRRSGNADASINAQARIDRATGSEVDMQRKPREQERNDSLRQYDRNHQFNADVDVDADSNMDANR